MTADPIERALMHWRKRGVPLQTGYAASTVATMLASAGRDVSSDALRLFTACNGMREGESDESFFSLWPLEQCIKEAPQYEASSIPFADFFIASCVYWLKHESPDRSSVWTTCCKEQPTKVASSIDEFFALLMAEPERLGIVPI